MKLILFLGSGISIDSGHPSVVALTDRILNSNEQANETIFLNALKNYDEEARLIGGNAYSNSEKTVGEIYRNYTSYEDLYYLCEEITAFDWGMHNNSMVPAFMESLCENFSGLLHSESKREKLIEIGKYAHAAKTYINNSIINELPILENNIIGLDLIIQLANNPVVTSLIL